jgi:hypothetical protein
MAKVNHAQRAHALLSASGAHRWLNCTPSAKLEEAYGERKSSPYAAEGTLAHELSELYLKHDVLKTMWTDEFMAELDKVMAHELFNDEMLDVIPIYTDYCRDQFNEALQNSIFSVMEIEQKLDLTEYIPESFGTADCVIISDGVMEVIDLKYGKGVPVYADYNPQLMLYGLGALNKYDFMYEIESVKLTVVQPRLNNISSFLISVEELRRWANDVLKPQAELAFSGEGELNAGEWCKFCAVKNKCRALYEKQIELAKYEFKEPKLLSDEEIADILGRIPQLVEWANSVSEYAKDEAVNHGKAWPGYKLVEGRSIRKWSDEDLAAKAILSIPGVSEDQVYNTKLKGISDIEKLVGKKIFAEKLSEVVVKPQGAPTLVPESDKRPAMGISQAIKDFE